MSERDTLFISHATPADNEFSIWLASRLEMLGYKVWLDKNQLLGGERFWNTIQKGINQAIKVLLVYSKNIVDKEGNLRQGIEDELSYAKDQAWQDKLKDFIIPLHLDNSGYGLAIGMPNINHVPFNEDWAEGLRILLKKLKEDGVMPSSQPSSSFSDWYKNSYVSNVQVKKRSQTYFSSWIGFKQLPESFYIYRYPTEEEAKQVRDLNDELPINRNSNILTTFEHELRQLPDTTNRLFEVEKHQPEIYKISIQELLSDTAHEDDFPTHTQMLNAFRRLLLCVWNFIMRKRGMLIYEMSGRRFAYYRQVYDLKHKQIEISPRKNKKRAKKKAITGKHKSYIWHYALSARILTPPLVGYDLKSHIVFSLDGKDALKDDKIQHRLRRAKGKSLFNEAWRDMLRAFIKSLKDEYGRIGCYVGYDDLYAELNDETISFLSDYDYIDPNTPMTEDSVIGIISDEENDDE